MRKKALFFFCLFLLFIYLACAKNQSITVEYNYNLSKTIEQSIDFSDLLLKVTTANDSSCRYDSYKGMPFESMDSFDLTYGKLHEKNFLGLGDGIYKIYIKCMDNSSFVGEETELILRVSSLVSAGIALDSAEPLKEGRYEVSVVTSKPLSTSPTLSMSDDGITYDNIPLTGSEKSWKGHLIIPRNFGVGVVSFKFKGIDLEGREGGEISSGNAFLVDTAYPSIVSSFSATGFKGEIRLEWSSLDTDIDHYRLFRSISPNLESANFYREVTGETFLDTSVQDGETYYYRISAVDSAGNEGSSSIEVHATALISNSSQASVGLDSSLIGSVDRFLKEIDYLSSDIGSLSSSVSQKEGKEKELFQLLGLEKKISDSKTELTALRRDVDNYKQLSLDSTELDKKLNSANLKLEIIKKSVPESIILSEELTDSSGVESSKIQEVLLETRPQITERQLKSAVQESQKLTEESEIALSSSFYNIEIVYLDGSRKQVSLIKREISSLLESIEWHGNGRFYEIVPKGLAESASEIKVLNSNYVVEKEDPIISFSADSKQIIYYVEGKKDMSLLKDPFVVFISEPQETEGSAVTGLFILDSGLKNAGLGFGVFLVFAMFVYLLFIKKRVLSPEGLRISLNLREAFNAQKNGSKDTARNYYSKIQEDYLKLSSLERKKVYKKIEKLKKKLEESR